jgi:hypothetical protein
LVFKCGNWFNNDCSNISSGISSWFHNFSNFIKASIFFSFIFLFKLSIGVAKFWEWSAWPVECWSILKINSTVTAWKSSNRVTMITILKSKNTKVWYIINSMWVCILQEGNSKSCFICLSCSSIVKVNLGHPWRGNRHHNFSQEISIIVSRENWCVNSMANEAIVKVTLSFLYNHIFVFHSYIDVSLMIVSKR